VWIPCIKEIPIIIIIIIIIIIVISCLILVVRTHLIRKKLNSYIYIFRRLNISENYTKS